MIEGVRFLAAELALAILGAGAGFHPSVRPMSVASRIAVSLCAGAVALTLEAILFSLAGIPWTVPGLSVPLLSLSVLCAMRWRRQPLRPREPLRVRRAVALWSCLAGGVALVFLVLSFSSSSATSMDFPIFWGVKAVRFADNRGISADFLSAPFSSHTMPEYPPLLPVVQGWGCLAAGKMPWKFAPILSALWLILSLPIVLERCRRVLGDDEAASVTGFWTSALAISLVYSYSGGNAEAPLLFFETVALVWLMTEDGASESRFVPLIALCGAALTKVEGSVAVALIAAGTVAQADRRGLARRAARALLLAAVPAAAVGTWFLYQASQNLPVGYGSRGAGSPLYPDNLGATLTAMLQFANVGSLWLPWILSLFLLLLPLLLFPGEWRRVSPALFLTAGLLAVLLFVFLHQATDPRLYVEWILPRVSQPALSAAILAAGLASLRPRSAPVSESSMMSHSTETPSSFDRI
jgi:hypothetical protein